MVGKLSVHQNHLGGLLNLWAVLPESDPIGTGDVAAAGLGHSLRTPGVERTCAGTASASSSVRFCMSVLPSRQVPTNETVRVKHSVQG